jgi:CubicO group peptidase (beta-lactamase class C family)
VATSVQASLTDFAEARLFSPLGIDNYRWPRDPGGNPLGYGHLEVRPCDLISLGRLFLARGDVRGRRVLDPAYVDRATRASTPGGEGRHYSCRASSGGSVVLMDETAEPVAAADFAHR